MRDNNNKQAGNLFKNHEINSKYFLVIVSDLNCVTQDFRVLLVVCARVKDDMRFLTCLVLIRGSCEIHHVYLLRRQNKFLCPLSHRALPSNGL